MLTLYITMHDPTSDKLDLGCTIFTASDILVNTAEKFQHTGKNTA
jgi:hypothetical protein